MPIKTFLRYDALVAVLMVLTCFTEAEKLRFVTRSTQVVGGNQDSVPLFALKVSAQGKKSKAPTPPVAGKGKKSKAPAPPVAEKVKKSKAPTPPVAGKVAKISGVTNTVTTVQTIPGSAVTTSTSYGSSSSTSSQTTTVTSTVETKPSTSTVTVTDTVTAKGKKSKAPTPPVAEKVKKSKAPTTPKVGKVSKTSGLTNTVTTVQTIPGSSSNTSSQTTTSTTTGTSSSTSVTSWSQTVLITGSSGQCLGNAVLKLVDCETKKEMTVFTSSSSTCSTSFNLSDDKLFCLILTVNDFTYNSGPINSVVNSDTSSSSSTITIIVTSNQVTLQYGTSSKTVTVVNSSGLVYGAGASNPGASIPQAAPIPIVSPPISVPITVVPPPTPITGSSTASAPTLSPAGTKKNDLISNDWSG
jgi:hypothetical protein